MRNSLASVLLVAICIAMPACDDDGETPAEDMGTEVDVGDDIGDDEDLDVAADPDAGEESFAFEIEVRLDPGDDSDPVPTSGAVVACDMPDGSRVENTTDESGRVPALIVDWRPDDTMTVTAYVEGYRVASFIGLPESVITEVVSEEGVFPVTLWPRHLEDNLIELSGEAVNMSNPGQHSLVVSTTLPGTYHSDVGAAWSVGVPPGVPFEIVAFETAPTGVSIGNFQNFVGWTVIEHAAITEPTVATIDLNETVEAIPLAFKMILPDHGLGSFFSNARPFFHAMSLESEANLFIGAPSHRTAVEGELAWDMEGQYIELEGVTPISFYHLGRDNNENSVVWRSGYPVEGDLALPFVEPPQITHPTGLDRLALDEALTWETNAVDAADPDLIPFLFVTSLGGESIQIVWMQPGTTSLTLPALPTGVDPSAVYGDVARAHLLMCVYEDPFDHCARHATSRFFGIEP